MTIIICGKNDCTKEFIPWARHRYCHGHAHCAASGGKQYDPTKCEVCGTYLNILCQPLNFPNEQAQARELTKWVADFKHYAREQNPEASDLPFFVSSNLKDLFNSFVESSLDKKFMHMFSKISYDF